MKRFWLVVRVYLCFVLLFLAAKPLFMLYNRATGAFTASDVLAVVWHGLPLDLSTAGYLTALPLLFALVSLFCRLRPLSVILKIYFIVTALCLSVILCVDTALYRFWGFKLDATVFNYIDSPRDALASVSPWFLVIGVAWILILAFIIAKVLTRVSKCDFVFSKSDIVRSISDIVSPSRPLCRETAALLLLGGLMFLGVRGGVGRSTMNIGRVYYSDNQFLNHSAVNPAFSLIYSSLKVQRFDRLYRFHTAGEQTALVDSLQMDTTSISPQPLLRTSRPDVVVLLLEGFCSAFIESLGGERGVTPEFDRLSREGVLFTRCYANSFRTDRGTIAVFSGYPAFPDLSVMKLPDKSRSLPSLARSLAAAGYTSDFLYGGDINFTNMKSYLMATGYRSATGDTHFPVTLRRTHAWGVTDHIAFDTLYHWTLRRARSQEPFHLGFLSLASHEPWQVPYNRIPDNERANAMAYTDHCIGQYIDRLRRSPAWDNLLVILIADHGITYPDGITEADEHKYRIPMLWLGGAVKEPRRIETLCNQTDLCATLLGQMRLPHHDFRFSRDVMSQTYRYPFAFHTASGVFAFIDSTGVTVNDLTTGRNLTDSPSPSPRRLRLGRAMLQTAADDLAAR